MAKTMAEIIAEANKKIAEESGNQKVPEVNVAEAKIFSSKSGAGTFTIK